MKNKNDSAYLTEYVAPQEHIWPDIKDWPLYQLYKYRTAFVNEINQFTYRHFAIKQPQELLEMINKALYKERARMKRSQWKVDPPNEKLFWKKIANQLAKASHLEEHEQKEIYLELLSRIINRYTEEITGNFKIKTFLFARKFLTFFFGRLLNAAASKGIPRFWGTRHRLKEKLRIVGHVEHVRHLFSEGIVVIVPTHFSNLDSILIGYVIDLVAGMPAFHYGAGLNLYNSEIAAYFMNRLGAYRLDRRKKNSIYMQTLKSMSTLSIEKGVNTIFFPGGTRSRSGRIEHQLKLGLLSTCIDAQRRLIEQGDKRKIYIVPVVLNYHFVLEAKYLIEQHLQERGREKYIRSADRSKKLSSMVSFIYRLLAKESDIITSFGAPMDVLGNQVTMEGRSIDQKGTEIAIEEYFMRDGEIVHDEQRESIYTRYLGEQILSRYKKDNVVLSSHLVAFTAFKLVEKEYDDLDVFAIIRLPEEDYRVDIEKFKSSLYIIVNQVIEKAKHNELRFTSELLHTDVEGILQTGIQKLGMYHSDKPLYIKNKHICSKSFKLLYYYHNRLDGYGLQL